MLQKMSGLALALGMRRGKKVNQGCISILCRRKNPRICNCIKLFLMGGNRDLSLSSSKKVLGPIDSEERKSLFCYACISMPTLPRNELLCQLFWGGEGA